MYSLITSYVRSINKPYTVMQSPSFVFSSLLVLMMARPIPTNGIKKLNMCTIGIYCYRTAINYYIINIQ